MCHRNIIKIKDGRLFAFFFEVGILIAIRGNGFRFLWLSKLVVNF